MSCMAALGTSLGFTSHGQDLTWTLTDVLTNADLDSYYSVVSSSDGTKLAAVGGGGIYTSTNSGATWSRASAPMGIWSSVASSSDGTKLVVVGNGEIISSADSGDTWSKIDKAPASVNWASHIASSADGTKLVVAIYSGENDDGIYTSANSGKNWAKTSAPMNMDYYSVESSADGTKMVAAASEAGIYISVNSGRTWKLADTRCTNWTSAASSLDGTKLAAIAYNDINDVGIFTSTNSGLTWVRTDAPTSTNWYWISIASSCDGAGLVAAGGGGIYASTNSGASWKKTSAPNATWCSVASSSDGNKLVAAAVGGRIYVGRIRTQSNN